MPRPGMDSNYDDDDNDNMHLSEETREWLEGLREEDIVKLKHAADFVDKLHTVARVNRYLLVVFFTVLIGVAQFGESITNVFKWIQGGK